MNRKDLIELYQAVFESDNGKKVLEDMKQAHYYDEPVVVPNDPISTGYRDGEKTPIRRIMKILNAKEIENGREASQSDRILND